MTWDVGGLALKPHCCQAADVNNGQWWDGWVGALLAAAVTVGATIWWDARTKRRERLEEAVVRLNEAAAALGNEAQRHELGIGNHESLATKHMELGGAFLMVQGLARRHVLFLISPKLVAPAREGLARTIASLSRLWVSASQPQDPSGRPISFPEVVVVCQAISAACFAWLSRPGVYWPLRDKSQAYVRAMREWQGDEC